jgi:hypothetical protein
MGEYGQDQEHRTRTLTTHQCEDSSFKAQGVGTQIYHKHAIILKMLVDNGLVCQIIDYFNSSFEGVQVFWHDFTAIGIYKLKKVDRHIFQIRYD